jgi:hypothetical protein
VLIGAHLYLMTSDVLLPMVLVVVVLIVPSPGRRRPPSCSWPDARLEVPVDDGTGTSSEPRAA